MQKSKVYFIFLSIVISFIGSIFIVNHYYYTQKSFQANLDQQQQNLYNIYNSTLDFTYSKMSLQAKIFADNEQVQDLFLYGKKMLEIEGGLSGGEETAKIRTRLHHLVLKDWKESTKNLDVKIFQFHLGPGSLSFLRIHKPDKFGDKMDNLRFIIVDVNKEQVAKTGFETGRIASALRSVVPVFSWDTQLGKRVYVGAIEIGTSYDNLLQTIGQHFNVNLKILLNTQHIKQTVWDEFITVNYNKKTVNGCNCILESSSHSEPNYLLEHVIKTYPLNQITDTHSQPKTQVIQYKDKYYGFQFYPLRDYLGNKDATRKDVGSLFIAKDISDKMVTYQKEQFNNIIYALLAYFLIELILVFTFLKVTKHLLSQLKEQSHQLLEQRRVIDLDKVKYKNLIGTINSNYFFYSRNNSQFSFVSPSIQQVLGYSDAEFLNNTCQYLTDNSQSILFKLNDDKTFLEHKENTFEIDVINKTGRLQYLLITETIKYNLSKTQKVVVEGLAQDISHNRQEKMLLMLRCQILQMIADNDNQSKIMETLVLGIESIIQDISCAIMLLNQESKTLNIGAAPSIDKNLMSILDGQKVSSAMGSCGIAANTSKRIIIYDMKKDKEMSRLNKKIKALTYQSCWSEPILSDKAKVLATFDIYYKNKQKPNESDFAVIAIGIKLISSLL